MVHARIPHRGTCVFANALLATHGNTQDLQLALSPGVLACDGRRGRYRRADTIDASISILNTPGSAVLLQVRGAPLHMRTTVLSSTPRSQPPRATARSESVVA